MTTLSQGQRALWFLHHLAPVGGAYNIAAAARVRTPLGAAALERAFQALVDRHAALRTAFPAISGEPCRQVAGEQCFALVTEDATGWDEERLRARLAEEAWRPFDLERGPLLRVTLFTGEPDGPLILLVIHHIVADFWSLAILMRELPALYREAALPPPGLGYEEHVRLEREVLEGERGEELLAWWRERLTGLPALELATDRPRPAVQTYRGDTARLRLPGDLAAALRARSRAQRGTLFMTLVAAFEALLGRHTGQEDLAIGSPRAGRGSSQFAGTVGYFVNPVVLRGDLSGDPPFAELLERTRAAVLAAFEHGDYPLPLLAEHLQPERDASRTPLFQVSFVLQKETRGAEGLTAFALGEEGVAVGPEDFRLESLSVPQPPSPFDLALHAVERQGGLSFALQYNTDLFDATTAERLLEHFARLLAGVAAEPRRRLSELPLLSEAEREQLLVEWNDTAVAPASVAPDLVAPDLTTGTAPLVHELVFAQARRQPEALAVATPDEQLTYGELADRAGRLAAFLHRHGVRPDVRVALCAGQTAGRVVGSLAILASGGACVHLDPEAPPERLRFLVADSEAAVVLTESALSECFQACRARVALIADAVRHEGPCPAPAAGPDHLAYVVYTSGSTGLPKGVAVSHAGLRNLVSWHRSRYGTGPADRATLIANPAFDASVWELWPHLAAGASLHVPAAETRLAPRAIVSFWRNAGITWSFLPTPLAEEVMAEEDLTGLALRGLLCGGDRLRQAPRSGLPFALINHYGPSEVSVVSTCSPVLPESSGAPPIGRPIDNLRAFVADPRGGLLPRGAVGELWLGGVGLARGYLGRPGLTAERFVPDPWSGEAGGRLYRTGDLVRHLPDGNLEFFGRIDNQIKLRGYRIELGEIEAALHGHPAVGEAAVAFLADEKRLVAYVVAAAGEEAPSGRELRQHLRERLPVYMVPAVYVTLPALPRTPNGKLDRKALPAPAWDAAAEAPGTSPRTPAEELLAGIFAEVLGTGPIGAEDGFFERGGHSLAALRLVARIREAFGVELPISRVFETPAVGELATEIESRARSSAPLLPPLRAVPRDRPDDPLPLSFAQQRLWFLHQLDPASPVYNVPAAIDLRGGPDPVTLAAALGEVARRHEALRTRLAAAPGSPAQVVDPPAPVLLPVIDLAQLPAARQQARRLAREEALRPFDLAAGPLLRALLVHLGGGEHLLLLTLHHVVCDGWSMRVLARELGEIYGTLSQGRPSPLPELAIQYGDYAVWQRTWLRGDVLEAELAHWRDRLTGAPPVLDLPFDRPRPAVVSHHGASRPLAFAPGLLPSLQSLARDQGVTLFMAALAAFQALLSRIGNTGDVSVGTPVAGRTQLQTEGLIGFFVNLLVLRTDLSGEPSFAVLLGRVREVALTAYAHQDLPFEKLVEELAPQRDLSYPPLFQVSFALENDPPPTLRLGEVEGTLWPLPQETEKVDLSLTLQGDAGQLSGTIGFRTSLFDGATIERLAGHFGRLLAGAVAEPRRRVTELPLLSEAETEQLLVEWSGAATAYPREATIHALFTEQAVLRPEAVAVVWEGGHLTYGELSRRAGALALRLAAWGVGPEVRVGVCLDRVPARIAATLAVLAAGGAYVPLDPSYPRERLAFLVRDSGASVLLTEERRRELLPQTGAAVLCLDQDDSREGAAAGPARAPGLPATALAYVMYTSGSTGEPKGVAVPHRAVVRLVRDTGYARFGPDEVFLQLAPYAFDASTLELWGALLNGGRVVMPPPGVPTPAELGDLLQRHGVTTLWLTAGLFHQMVDENLMGLSGVRQLLAGGDVLSVPHVRRVLAELPGTRLINGYGPTENTTFTCCHPVSGAELATSIPLGRPIANTRVYVLNRHFEPVPVGVAGELLTGGDGLARGYLGGPERTAERFVPDPVSEEPGGRLYRTGDLVRWRPSGNLEFLGRIDTQLKIRGFRVEPGEIETALLAHPGVREAVVLAPREEGGRRLVAYLAGADGAAPCESELRDFLRERLPDFMLPSGFVVLPALPLTAHGKVDRNALAALRPERSESTGPAPRTPTEELVAGIFAEVLGVERVGIADDFFALGGHSLLATRVASRARSVFGVELPVRTVFEAPTVEALAGWLERRAAGAPGSLAPIERVSRAEPLPLSFAQQRLWFLDRLEPGSPLYNIPVAVELAGRLDRPALEAALGEVVRRHEALRTAFRETAGGPVQGIAESIDFELPLVEIHSPQEEHRLSAEEARRPFDLEGGPLLRAVLLRSSPERHVLLLTLHHIVSDGWSMGVLVRELGALYAAFLGGRPSPLPELAVQYADFAAWQRRHLSGELLEAELAWWRGQLAGMPPALDLPADHPRPAVRSLRGASHAFAIPEEGLAALAHLSRRQGATLFMTLLAGFSGLLQRSTGEDDLGVGTPIAGRTRTETEPLIGLFVNTLVLRIGLSGDPELAELLGRIRETTLSAYAHQEVPFERLVEELAPERDLSRTPLVQVMFVLQNAPLGPLELPGLALAVSERTTETAKLDLACTLTETDRGLAGTIEYSRDLFEAPAIERMAGHLTRLLAGAAAEPRRRLSELPLLSEAETAQLLVEWAGAAEPFPATTLHAAFESLAERHPDLPAVVSGGTILTYRELDAAASRLARRLAALGVGPEVPVAFAFERSAAVVVAILGVLKAGGAWLPLDPSQPAERRAALLEAAGHPLLITEQDLAAPDPEGAVEPVPATPENLAYVLHTSGSTGQPKGVCCTHRGVVNLLADFARRQPLVPGSRGSLWTSLGFDVSVYEIFSSLLAGGAVHIVPEAVRQETESFLDWLAAERIDSAYVPPFLVAALQERLERTGEPRLRRLLVGVEPIPEAQLARIAELSPGLAVINGYGPTEATICATLYDVDPGRDRSGPSPMSPVTPIGRPAANSAVYLLDRHQQPVPVGVPGDLYIAGAGLARGYLGKPGATAERFVPHPWSAVGGERLYRTGDLVRHRPDGNLEFLGRIDHQIKLRGFRIEPGEIEAALLAHPGVREAVVMAVAPAGATALEGREHRRLVAWVVAGEGGVPSVQELQEHLRERLPAYMVPAAFVLLPAFPLTPSGKLDRRALPAPEQAAAEELKPPRTPAEELVAGIFSEVLGVERVGIADDFFALGGHSLLATRVASRVRSVFGVELPVRTVFEAPTVEALAGWLERRAAGAGRPLGRGTPIPGPGGELPVLSFAQQRLWFLDQLEPGTSVYNIPVAVELTGRLDFGALEAALGEVVRRHQVLRTAFRAVDGEPVQVVAEWDGFTLPRVDVRDAVQERLLIAEEARRPFDLQVGPLLRAVLLRSSPGRHVLLLTLHHIVSDGWSMGVLVREIGALYAAFAAGRPSPLPEPALQYADFAAWQRRHLAGEHLEAELAWWREHLAGMPPVLDLPVDHRPPARSTRGGVCELEVDRETLAGLTAFARGQGATLFMTLLAGFAVLLERQSAQDDLAVATPVAGRLREETEPLIGLFVNTLVLRIDLSGDPELAELLDRVRETALSAYAHQEVPFERLVEELVPERDLSRPPLVQVMLALQNTPEVELVLPGLTLRAADVPNGTAKLDLTCTWTETERGLTGAVEYSRDLFEAPTVERLAGHLTRLLAGAAADPRRRLSELPLLSAAETAQLLVEWSDGGTLLSGNLTLHQLFEAQVARTPKAVALVAGRTGERWTYRELDLRAGSLARRLAGLGVGPEVRVGVCLSRTPLLVASLLAVLKAGGAYVPLDPDYPGERLAFLLDDAAAAVLVTEPGLAERLPEHRAELLLVDADLPLEEEPRVAGGAGPDNLAYLIYTSGSTGKPKGVAIEHRSAVAFVHWVRTVFPPEELDGVLAATSISFDLSVFELFGTLSWGGKVVLAANALELPRLAAAGEVVLVNTVPSAMAELVRQGAVPASVRTVNLAGEPLQRSLVQAVYEGTGVARVLDLYGPSESTTYSTWAPAARDEAREPLIGRPINGTRVVLAGLLGEPVAAGVPGELLIGGAGLARGYLGRPDLTAERFVPDPWSADGGARLYRTGDLTRWLPDGRLDYLGRIDRQVKVRGSRIELGEIEAALVRHPAVLEAVVLAHPDLPGGAGLAAYLVTAGEEAPEVPGLRDFLRQWLPEPMLPAAWTFLLALPLTPRGKIDRKALAKLRSERSAVEVGGAPRTPTEELLAEIFAGVLGVERVGIAGDFFALGGHSLLATRLVARVRSLFGVDLPVRAIFEAPTVEALAGRLGDAAGGAAISGRGIGRSSRKEPLPLSFAQQRLWFLDRLEPGSPLYNIPVAVELAGRLDRPALEAALGEVVRRHEALRTVFRETAGGPVQEIAESIGFHLPLVEVHSPQEEHRLSVEEARRPFDLERGPLVRAVLLRSSPERHVLLLTLHHIVSDGWSMGVLVRELGALYAAFLAGRPSPLPELAIQYADFAAWQRRYLSGELLAAELAWWRSQLAGMPPALDLPADHPRPAVRSLRGASHGFAIPGEGLAALTQLARHQGATLFMTLFAGFCGLLHRSTGENDLAVATPVAGRTRTETEPLIGLFVNTLVLRLDLSGDPAPAELLGRVRETALSAYAHQEVPFERLVEELAPERDLSRTPLAQVMFVLQNAPLGALELPGLALAVSDRGTETAKLDLTCTLTETERGLAGAIEYSRDLFEAPTVERLAGHLTRLLAGAAADPRRRLSELPLLSAAETAQLLVEWSDGGTLPSGDLTLHQLFEAQVARTPEAVALVAGRTGERWTYRELDLRAGSLARRLAALGVGPEVRVGVCLSRTPWLVASLLAVLKAGGAYVPLDPDYPGERLAFMLEDTAAAVLVTEPGLAGQLPAHRAELLLVDPDLPPEEGPRLASGAGPENLAYLIYTSGSTGKPKGVAIEHRSAVAFVHWMRTVFPPEELDGVLAATSISFDLSVFELFGTLSWGGKVVLAANALELPHLAAAGEVVLVNTVPSAMAELVRQGAVPESVRTVNLAGEPLKRSLVQAIYEGTRVARVLDLYGPSESTTYSTWAAAARDEAREPLIGRPVAGTRVVLAGLLGEPVAAGVPGELLIGGAGLARGYLHRPDLTAERFVPDPWSADGGARLYRTGDLARWLPDGRLDYLGRIDRQVKVRGFRIELGEIEVALARHPAVREAVVLADQNLVGGAGLAAYVVAAGEEAPDVPGLRDFLRQRLPEHMLPAAWAFLPELPLTPSGKIDRKALAKLRPERPATTESEAPRTPAEELLAEIFAGVLGVERVGVSDDFFALGGHSLLATRLVARVRTVFGVELPVRAVFEAPTVERMAMAIAEASRDGRLPESRPQARSEEIEALPLSFGQERLWFLQQLEPESAAYDMPVQIELSGVLHRDVLAAALTGVVCRHESLRTAFGMAGGSPVQRIAPPPSAVPLPLADLSDLPPAAGGCEAERLESEHAGLRFDLERGPLFSALLVHLGAERHRLLLNLHHIVSDGWSIQVLVRDLGVFYGALLAGRPVPLPELPIQYGDFALWQREQLAARHERELAYWESRLGAEAASAELPTDRPRPAVQTYRGGRQQLVLSPDLTARLQRLGREQGVTLFMTLLSAAKTVLFRHSSEPVVTVGAPVAGRRQAETEELIGFFLNTLALRTDLSGGPTFRELLARVRTTTLEAYSHQDVPFEAVLARLRLDRDLSRSPLFQVLFNLLNLPARDFSLPGLELRLLTPAEVPSKLDLTFYVSEAEASVWIHLVYNADLFDAARIAELLAQLELLLELVAERPDEPVDHLPLLTAAARAVLPDPRETLAEPAFPPVGHLFLDRARALPEQTAVCWSGGAWTYAELEARAGETARRILAAGGGAGQVVAVSGNRSPELIAGLLGVFLAGGVLLILDRKLPAARLQGIVEEAKPGCLVYAGVPRPEDGWLRELESLPVVPVPAAAAGLPEPSPGEPALAFPCPAPDDPAYIFFTSGSTGRPKAVLGRQKGLSHFLTWQRETFGIGPGERAAQLTGPSFDVVLRDTFLPLVSGATLVLPDEDDLGPDRVLSWLAERAVTLVHTVPSLAGAWLGAAPAGFGSETLRWTFFAGEPLLDQVVVRWRAAFPRAQVINLYGATETTLAKCFYRVPDPPAGRVQPAGAPMPQTQALVLAGGVRPCGLGEIGEIVLRTPFRSLGYLNQPAENRLRFRPNPFREEAEDDLLYFTGDRGRYRLDGALEILGRLDDQVKIRGVRIEPAEIRATLGRHPGVLESTVGVREARAGEPLLVAYVVPRPGVALDPEDLRRHLRRELPEAMVPSAFAFLPALPLTPTGKLDRRALAQHAWEVSLPSGEPRSPRTPIEEMVAGVWAEVLKLPHVGPDDNFFQLGGHSLTGAQMISRVRQVLQVDLPLRVLFEAPTVAGLAAEIEGRRRADGAPGRPPISAFRQERSTPPPLSFAQERFWAWRHLEYRSVASTIPVMALFEGRLDLDCLRQALQEVVDRHEVLRTSFRDGAEGPVQVIHPAVPVQFPVVDLEPLDPACRMEQIRFWSTLDGRTHFDFERGPLFRLTLFRCSERENLFLFVVHHIASDGWSHAVLLGELAVLYNALCEGRPSPLPPLAAQYQDFSRWQRHVLAGEALEREIGFWREHLHGAVPLDLRGDRPLPARRTFAAGLETFTVPEDLERKLDAFSTAHGVTLFMTLLAAFNVLLHEETGREDMVVTCLFANRNQVEIENLIGNFFAGLPLRTRFSGRGTFRELLEMVRAVTLAAHEHPDILYEPVMEGMSILEPGDRGGLATFRVMFQLSKVPPAEQALSGVKVTRLPFDTGKIRQDLTLFLYQSGRLAGRFKYNRDVIEPERAARMRDRYLEILAMAVADPDCRLDELLESPLSPDIPEPVPAGAVHREHESLGGAP